MGEHVAVVAGDGAEPFVDVVALEDLRAQHPLERGPPAGEADDVVVAVVGDGALTWTVVPSPYKGSLFGGLLVMALSEISLLRIESVPPSMVVGPV